MCWSHGILVSAIYTTAHKPMSEEIPSQLRLVAEDMTGPILYGCNIMDR